MADKKENQALGFKPDSQADDLGFKADAPQDDLGFVPDPQRETDVVQSVKAGIQNFGSQQLVSKGLDLAEQAIDNSFLGEDAKAAAKISLESNPAVSAFRASQKLFAPDADFVPTTPAEKQIAEFTTFFDPATLAVGTKALQFGSKALKVAGLIKRVKDLKKLAKVAKGSELLGVDDVALNAAKREINRRLLGAKFKQLAAQSVSLAGAGAAEEATRESIQQGLQGEIDPQRLAEQTALGAATGAVAGPVASAAGAAIRTAGRTTLAGARGAARLTGRGVGKARQIFTADKPVPSLEVDEVFKASKAKAKALKEEGIIQEVNEDGIAQQLFFEELERKGIAQSSELGIVSSLERQGLNTIELSDKIDRKVGTLLTETTERLIQKNNSKAAFKSNLLDQFGLATRNLERLGISRNEITPLLFHVENAADGSIRFNPEARQLTKNFSRRQLDPALEAKVKANPQIVEELGNIRRTFNSVVSENPLLANNMGFIDGYVPIITKRKNIGKADLQPGSTKQVEEVFFMKPRQARRFNPSKHETDFTKLANFYANAAAKHVSFKPELSRMVSEITKLRWLGRGNEAQTISKRWARILGIKSNVDLNKLFRNELADANQQVLNDFAELTPDPQKFLEEALDVLKSTTFDSLVFMNPKTLIKQAIQPELVGSGEIGLRAMIRGRRLLATKEGKRLAKEAMDLLRARDSSDFAELRFDQINNKFLRASKKVSGVLAKPGQFVFDRLDVRNRGVAYLGARDQFLKQANAQNLERILDGMIEGEKNTVRKIFREQGFEAAANMYGLIRSRRINYAYGIADTGDFWAEGIGRHIPFTTWSRNQLARVIGDVRERNVKKLAARVVKPIIILSGIKMLTGYDIPGAHPLQAIPGAVSGRPFPAVATPAEEFAISGGDLGAVQRELLSFTPVGPALRFKRDFEKAEDSVEAFTRLKRVEDDSFIGKTRKQILRELKR